MTKSDHKRTTVDMTHVHPMIADKVGGEGRLVAEAQAAIESNDVVVLGMAQNPFPKKACNLLDEENITYKYLGWGSYFSQWKPRLEIKMWAGWKTFPMVFVKGIFIGGFTDLKHLNQSGVLKEMLKDDDKGEDKGKGKDQAA